MEPSEVLRLKQVLALDAANAAGDRESTAWLEPEQWKNYMGKETRKALYGAFPDEELLAVLRETAARLGRNPSKKEVFCVYRVFLIQRFGNWPRALTAAGLKRPREQRRADNRRRNEEALRRRKAQELSGQAAAKEAGLTTKTEGEA